MNTTTNYGLKLYEGTDLFNPLTVENVNAGDIDTTMKAISDHSVGAATELTTGTVHAITRADTDRNVFLFVATSNFTAGDTFTLDGNQVSALTPDGQQLATGSYVIGSSVLCALHDTLITVYVNPAKAKDADMLDGHDSSYYATDSDLDTVAGTIQAVSDKVGTAVLTTTAPDLSGAVNELNTHLTVTDITSQVSVLHGKAKVYRYGNIVNISWAIDGYTIPTGETSLITGLPESVDVATTIGDYPIALFQDLGSTGKPRADIFFEVIGTTLVIQNLTSATMGGVSKGGNITYLCK